MAYDNNMSGMLSRNERKKEDRHPDYTGQCEIDGRKMWISAWIKEGKQGGKMEGKKFFSLSFKDKDAQTGGAASPEEMEAKAASAAPKPATSATPSEGDDIAY